MTAISYPDCRADSPTGCYTLEARSPHNGTIYHRDGRPPSADEYGLRCRSHQSEFRYRLLDNSGRGGFRAQSTDTRSVLWERWQDREDSPGELVVSDDGWSIIRTHGFAPEVIAVSPSGEDAVRVRIADDMMEQSPFRQKAKWTWNPCHPWQVGCTSAGIYWSECSWRYFVAYHGQPHFVWRSASGQRLLIDLSKAVVVPAGELSEGLSLALVECEKRQVIELFTVLSPQLAEVRALLARERRVEAERDPLEDQIMRVKAAAHLAGIHRIKACIPFLKAWEEIDCLGMSTGCIAMGGNWWFEMQYYRPIVQHSLRLLDTEPLGFAAYHFREPQEGAPRWPVPERLTVRHERSQQMSPDMSAPQVLQLLGSPDFISKQSHQVGDGNIWTEDWAYDFQFAGAWRTLRIGWKVAEPRPQISGIEQIPADWLQSDKREREILRY